ncbi:MAG: hypothetical protein Q4G47_08200 [Lachnospiraceae bacterium]|nr:hypothetical protein [Lachnospiraceae bacterium]
MIGKKGYYGYIKRGRRIFGAVTFCLLAAVLVMYFGARWYFKTNKNVFTILAALSCIGVGKFAVDFIMFCRARGCSESAREAVELHIGKLAGAYDLYMTSYDKNFAISHAVCAGRSVCALTEDEKCDIRSGEMHLRTMLENDGFKGYTVKIFRNLDNYTERLDDLNRLEENKERKSIQSVMDLLKSISL